MIALGSDHGGFALKQEVIALSLIHISLMDKIISITDKEERKAAYAEVQEAYYDQAYGYAVHENVDVYCMASNLKGVVRTSGYLNFQYCYFD